MVAVPLLPNVSSCSGLALLLRRSLWLTLHHPWSRVLQQTRGYGWWLDAVLEMLQEPTSTDLLFPWETICNTFKQCLTPANTSLSFNCGARQIKYKCYQRRRLADSNPCQPLCRKLGFHIKSLHCAGNTAQTGDFSDNCEGIMQCNFLVPYTATIYG